MQIGVMGPARGGARGWAGSSWTPSVEAPRGEVEIEAIESAPHPSTDRASSIHPRQPVTVRVHRVLPHRWEPSDGYVPPSRLPAHGAPVRLPISHAFHAPPKFLPRLVP